jgi:hypothetical protein
LSGRFRRLLTDSAIARRLWVTEHPVSFATFQVSKPNNQRRGFASLKKHNLLRHSRRTKSEGPGAIPLNPGPSALRVPLGGDPPLLYACLTARCPAQCAGGSWSCSKPYGYSTAASAGGRYTSAASATKSACTVHAAVRKLADVGVSARRADGTRAASKGPSFTQPDNASTGSVVDSRSDPTRKIQ